MEKVLVKRVCPLPAELSEIKKNIPCTEEGCNRMFLNSPNLDMHLLKHHKKTNKQLVKNNGTEVKYQYHCPVDKCSYNLKSDRFFKNMKYLKQHFLKVHAEKNFYCDKCQKGFSTEAAQKKHVRLCGVKFVCSCNYSYDSYEALITHAKRHQHSFDEKFKSYGRESILSGDDKNISQSSCLSQDLNSTSATIAVPVHLFAAVALNELSGKSFGSSIDKGIQTETRSIDSRRHKKGPSPCRSFERSRRRTSTHTQTGQVTRIKHPKISIQTQTMGDYILRKAMRDADIPVMQKSNDGEVEKGSVSQKVRKRRKSMETQTSHSSTSCGNQANYLGAKYSHTLDPQINLTALNNFASTFSPLNSNNDNLYPLDIDVLPDIWLGQKNTSGTQTSPVALNSLMTDLNLSFFESEECSAGNSNTEASTQNLNSLANYFDDTDSNFPTSMVPPVPFGSGLNSEDCRTSVDPLVSLGNGPIYSSVQMGGLLNNKGKPDFDESRSCSIETQTEVDVSNFLSECEDDPSFTLCTNIETQTTEEFTSSLDHLLYSNMCTQTCDEILFSDLGFVDIETQTAWPQYSDDSSLVSTETQTALSGCPLNPTLNTRPWLDSNNSMSGTSQIETQTCTNEFREIIAELMKQEANNTLL